MRLSMPALALLSLLPALATARAAGSAWDRCSSDRSFRIVVDGCNEVLRSERDRTRRARALMHRGSAYIETGLSRNEDRALADLDASIDLDPSLAEAYTNRAELWLERQDTDRAIADFGSALRIEPDNADILSSRAVAYLTKKDWDRAIADDTAILRLKPHDPDTLRQRGGALDSKGDLDGAIADFGEVVRLDPSERTASIRWQRGLVYAKKGDWDRAIADYSETLRLAPADRFANGSRAAAYERKGELKKALADILIDLRLWPGSPVIEQNRDRVRAALAAAEAAGGPPAGETLDEARTTEFFAWAHFEPTCEPQSAPDGAWRCFRTPASGLLRAVAELDLLVQPNGRIAEARLGLDRGFIGDPVNGAFARDMARSFLRWAVPDAEYSTAYPLIKAIETSAPDGARKVFVAPGGPVVPDTTGAFEAFLGQRGEAGIQSPGAEVHLGNVSGPLPADRIFRAAVPASAGGAPGWLRIDVHRIY